MAPKIEIGKYYLITGHRIICGEMWNRNFPNGIFGKVIEIRKRFSPSDGRRLHDKITLRCYMKKSKGDLRHPHRETISKYLKPINE
ncbi:MAG: hypothetical protein ABI091_26475 [Ferruginibacter sp.]